MKKLFIILFLIGFFAGCDKPKTKETSEIVKKNSTQKNIGYKKTDDLPLNKKNAKSSFNKNANKILDKVIKKIDDFDAALGVQYARFSYETNRFLETEDTNYLSKISFIEFNDFFRDFTKTLEKRKITTKEHELLTKMTLDRIKRVVTEDDCFNIYDIAISLLEIECFNDNIIDVIKQWQLKGYEQFKKMGISFIL